MCKMFIYQLFRVKIRFSIVLCEQSVLQKNFDKRSLLH